MKEKLDLIEIELNYLINKISQLSEIISSQKVENHTHIHYEFYGLTSEN